MAEKQINPRMVWTVSILLALLFGSIGVLLLVYPKQFIGQHFGEDSFPIVRLVGAVLCVATILLLVPRTAWIGAVLLAVILLGIIGLALYQRQPYEAVVPALFLVSVGSLAYIRRPRRPIHEQPNQQASPVPASAADKVTK
jgi:hypothetical protein